MPGDLLGGGDSGGPQTTTSTSTVELSPEQKKLFGLLMPRAEAFGKGGLTLPKETGVAGFDPLQTRAQQGIINLAQPGSDLYNTLSNVTGAQNFSLGSVLFPETNPALSAATDAAIRPITEAYTQQVLPNIGSAASIYGQRGGSRQGIAEGQATGAYLRQVGDTSAQVQSDAYQKGLDTFIKGLALAPQTMQAQTFPSSILDIVGAQRQGQTQAELTEGQGRFFNEQLLDLVVAQELSKLAGTFGGGTSISEVTQPSAYASSPFGSALGAGLGSGLAKAVFGLF